MGQIGGIINTTMLFITQCMMWSLTVVCIGFSALRVVANISLIWGSPKRIVTGLVRLIGDALPMAALAFIIWMLGTQRFHDDPMNGYITGIGIMGVTMMLGPVRADFLNALRLEGRRRKILKDRPQP